MNREKIKKHLKENWFVYILAILAIITAVLGFSHPTQGTSNKLVESEVRQAEVIRTRKNAPVQKDYIKNPYLGTHFTVYYDMNGSEFDAEYLIEYFDERPYTMFKSEYVFNILDADGYQSLDGFVMRWESANHDEDYTMFNNYDTTLQLYGVKTLKYYFQEELLYDVVLDGQNYSTQVLGSFMYDRIDFTISGNFTINVTNTYYNLGYSDSSKDNYVIITQKEQEIANLETQLSNLQEQYNTLEEKGIDARGLLNTLISQPFNNFKTILNFEILGVNLFTFISSLLTVLIILYIIKKVI